MDVVEARLIVINVPMTNVEIVDTLDDNDDDANEADVAIKDAVE